MIPHYISEDNAALLVCAGISDTMLGTDTFYSNSENTKPNLVSKARRMIAKLEKNGNFVIYEGAFGPEGQTTFLGKRIKWQSNDLPGAKEFFAKNPGPYKLNLLDGLSIMDISGKNVFPIFKLNKQTTGKKTLQLDNTGTLNFRINGFPVWTLFPKGKPVPTSKPSRIIPAATAVTTAQATAAAANPAPIEAVTSNEMSTNNYVLPIVAALAGLYFFLKK